VTVVRSSFWPEGTVPIVLLPGGDQGQRVLALAQSWVQLGLLGPALWVLPEDVTIEPDAPPLIVTRVLRLGEDRNVIDLRRDLFEVLARDELSRVMVLTVRSATPQRELDVVQDNVAHALSRYVKHSVPSADPNQNISEQQLTLSEATLICAPTEFQVTQRVGWATDDLGIIVVASPEDRSSPWSGDAFVRDNERFVGFCLMHIATVAGIWNTAPVDSFDPFSQDASSAQSIWVSRVFVNAVMVNGYASRVAAGVLAAAADGNADLVDASLSVPPTGTAFIPEDRRDHYAQRLVDGVFHLDNRQLDYAPAEPFTLRDKDRLAFAGQVALFASFSLDKMVAIPRWAGRWIAVRASRSATAVFHGDEGLAIVGRERAQLDLRDQLLLTQRDRVAAEVVNARTVRAAHDDIAAVRSTPGLWSKLRELMFGVLDGSADLSEVGFAPIEDKVPIFARVSDVIQPTDDRWQFPLDDRPDNVPATIGLDSLEDAGQVTSAVQLWVGDAHSVIAQQEAEREEASRELEAAEARRLELAAVLAEHHLVEFDADGVPTVVKGKRAPNRIKIPRHSTSASAEGAVDTRLLAVESVEEGTVPEPGGSAGEITEGALVEGNAAGVSAEEAPEHFLNLVPLKREFVESPKRLAKAQRSLDTLDTALEASRLVPAKREAVSADLDKWIARHQRSVYAQIVAGMVTRRERAAADVAGVEASIEALRLPEPGQLIALRQKFHQRLLSAFFIDAGIVAVYFGVRRVWPDLARLGWWPNPVQVSAIAAAALLLAVLAILVRYHRGWSRVERLVLEAGDQLAWSASAAQHARRELRRMEVLHRQALEWLRLLAEVMHRPWSIKETWLSADPPSVSVASLPYALRLAVTRDDDLLAMSRTQREMAQALFVKGWRARAFSKLLAELNTRLGYKKSELGLDALDADLPHASNHSRRILAQHASDSDVLQTVAQTYLREIAASVQGASLSQSSPGVSMIAADPLADNDHPQSSASSLRDPRLEWDRFLLDSLVGRPNPVTPIGSLGIAEMALAEAHHENVSSFLLLPHRLVDNVAASHGQGKLAMSGYADTEARPVDLVLRVDVVGPIPAAAARLWEKANSKPQSRVVRPVSPREGL
jgi:hypothetical protein